MTTLSITLSILLVIGLAILILPLSKKMNDPMIKKVVIGIAVFIPVFSMGSYFALGTPQFAEISTFKAPPQQVTLVDKLEEKLKHNPKDINGWMLLGRSHMVTKEYAKAIKAYEQAYKLQPQSVDILLPLADALAIHSNGSLEGRPYQLLQEAYTLDSENQMGLWLLGLAEKQTGNPDTAAKHWKKLYTLLPAESDDKVQIKALLLSVGHAINDSDIEKHEAQEPAKKETFVQIEENINDDSPYLQFYIAPEIKQTHPTATVFIYVKEPSGMPMPIAAQKIQIRELPAKLIIGAKDTLSPSRQLVDFDELVVGVKITDQSNIQGKELFKQEQAIKNDYKNEVLIKL